jgi:hypothetical protein
MAVASRKWVWFDISPVFTDFSNSDVEYLAFLSKQGEIVSSEPLKHEEKMSSWRNDIQSLVKKCRILAGTSIFSQVSNRCRGGCRVHVDVCINGCVSDFDRDSMNFDFSGRDHRDSRHMSLIGVIDDYYEINQLFLFIFRNNLFSYLLF